MHDIMFKNQRKLKPADLDAQLPEKYYDTVRRIWKEATAAQAKSCTIRREEDFVKLSGLFNGGPGTCKDHIPKELNHSLNKPHPLRLPAWMPQRAGISLCRIQL